MAVVEDSHAQPLAVSTNRLIRRPAILEIHAEGFCDIDILGERRPTVSAGAQRASVRVNVTNLETAPGELEVETESPPGHRAAEDAAAICPVRVVAGPAGCRVIRR